MPNFPRQGKISAFRRDELLKPIPSNGLKVSAGNRRGEMKMLSKNDHVEAAPRQMTPDVGTRLFAWSATAILTVVLCFVSVLASDNRIGILEWAIWVGALVIASTLLCVILPIWMKKRKSLLRETSLLFIGLCVFDLCWNLVTDSDLATVGELLLGWLALSVPFFLIYSLVAAGVTALVGLCIGRFSTASKRAKS